MTRKSESAFNSESQSLFFRIGTLDRASYNGKSLEALVEMPKERNLVNSDTIPSPYPEGLSIAAWGGLPNVPAHPMVRKDKPVVVPGEKKSPFHFLPTRIEICSPRSK